MSAEVSVEPATARALFDGVAPRAPRSVRRSPDGAASGALRRVDPHGTAGWTVVHDFTFQFGGAERVTRLLRHALGSHTLLHYLAGDPRVAADLLRPLDDSGPDAPSAPLRILPRWVNESNYQMVAPLYPTLLTGERATVQGNVLASSYAFAHHVRCTGAKIVYCHSPMRQIWSGFSDYRRHGHPLRRASLSLLARQMRRSDGAAARTADRYIATNVDVAERIAMAYGIDAEIVPPAIDPVFCLNEGVERTPKLLWVGRITEPYKNLRLVLATMWAMPHLRLVVVGDGPDREELEAAAPPNVEFVGAERGPALARRYQQSAALIFASNDDFGLVPVESQACGTPVVALRRGGARHTVSEETGVFFDAPDVAELARAITRCLAEVRPGADVAARVASYSYGHFDASIRRVVDELV